MSLAKYEAVFKDKFGTDSIIIQNDFEELFFELRGVKFQGISLDYFDLVEHENYSKEQLNQFSLNKLSNQKCISYELCGYELEFAIPTTFFDVQTKKYLQSQIQFRIKTGYPKGNGGIDYLSMNLKIEIKNEVFEAGSDYFEMAADKIENQLKGKYKMRNCFGCNYSDYSVYGQGMFGSMLCFANQKTAYLKVKSKLEYMNLSTHKRSVQETFDCEDFEFRGENIGYRG